MASMKLYYFDAPARAETSRLLLTYGKIPFEDVRITGEQWLAVKPTTTFGQLPVLEVDGGKVAQTAAIDRYTAAKAGLLPSDPLNAALADQWYFFWGDIQQLFTSTAKAEDKVAARKPIVEGAFKDKLEILDKHLEGKTYLLGDELAYADFALFSGLSLFQSGFVEGVPTDYLKDFPNVKAFRNRIASLEPVKQKYADLTTTIYQGFHPDA